jgi:hypothetical protein
MHSAVVIEASFTLLEMLNPVAARILKFWREISLYPAAFDSTQEGTG